MPDSSTAMTSDALYSHVVQTRGRKDVEATLKFLSATKTEGR